MGGKYNPEAYKKYYEENKDIINERNKQRRLNNLEENREKERLRNKSRFEYKKNYYEKNKDILNEKSCFFHYIDAFRDKNGGSRESDGV